MCLKAVLVSFDCLLMYVALKNSSMPKRNCSMALKVLTPRRSDKVVRIYYFIFERTDKVRSVDKAVPILGYSMFEICSHLKH